MSPIESQQANPATWYDATLTSVNGRKFLVELSNGTHVLCNTQDVTVSPGQETVTIYHWRETYGSGRRSCGCSLFCVQLRPYDTLNIQAGDTISVNIERSNRDGRGYVGFVTKILKTPQMAQKEGVR